jgi:NAD-dependent deacetylase
MNFPDELIRYLRAAERVAALTGAGVSQESGLRTFRDAQTGLWSQYKPTELASPEAYERDPKLVWDWYTMRREKVREVDPNPGHYALVDMARHIPDFSLITQNVDDLHRKAGSANVIELHGNLQRVRCSSCGQQFEAAALPVSVPQAGVSSSKEGEEMDGDVPRCQTCDGLLRPDVVWFGESLPRRELEAAVEAARACQIFFSIGTSGLVQPAASLAYAAHNRGAVVVEINTEPTPLTEKVDYHLPGRSGEILPALVQAVWR